jgi:PucR C-terminal helix-turn-helix domain
MSSLATQVRWPRSRPRCARVATLLARGASPEEVFAAVVAEVGHLLGVDLASLGRYEPDGPLTFVATWAPATRSPLEVDRGLGGTTSAPPCSRPAVRPGWTTRAARRLGIHENTVGYRIKQSEEVIRRSVDERRLELEIALRLAAELDGLRRGQRPAPVLTRARA